MKRSFAILLLFPVLYTQFGYYGQFLVMRWRIREAARETWLASLPDSAFVRLNAAAVDATGKWEQAGKECWYQGHLYDVIRTADRGNSTILFCLDDEREESLIRESGEVTKANLDGPDRKTGHSLLVSIGDLVCQAPGWSIGTVAVCKQSYPRPGTCVLPSQYNEIVGPPPKA